MLALVKAPKLAWVVQSNRAQDWLATAENDWLWGKDSADHGYCAYAKNYMSSDIQAKVLRPRVDLPIAAEAILQTIAQRLQGRVEAAYLFGSLAEGRATRDSDIDLLLVAPTDKPFLERWRDFADLLEGEYAIDLLVYTPAEFARLAQNPTVGFWRSFKAAHRRLV